MTQPFDPSWLRKPKSPAPQYYEDGTPIPAQVAHSTPVANPQKFSSLYDSEFVTKPFQQIQNEHIADQEDLPGTNAMANESNKASLMEIATDNALRPSPLPPYMGPMGKPMFGELPLVLGGEQGRQNYQDATDVTPNIKALEARAAVDDQEGKAREDVYKNTRLSTQYELAAIKQRQQQHQEQLTQKLQEYDAASQRYSNDLADTGKFWRNPGNIIASIGSVFAALGGKQSDYIEKAIAHDFAARRAAADTRLGAMRSNIEYYRQLFGDKEKGDMWALGEAHRVASDQVLEIGAHFQGPRAKAIMQEQSAALKERGALLKMEVYKRMFIEPQMMPGFKADMLNQTKGMQSGYRAFGDPQKPQAQQTQSPSGQTFGPPSMYGASTEPASFRSDSLGRHRAVQSDMTSGFGPNGPQDSVQDSPKIPASIQTGAKALLSSSSPAVLQGKANIDAKLAGHMNARVPGITSRIQAYRQNALSRAMVEAGRGADIYKINKEWGHIVDADVKNANEVAGAGYEKGYQEAFGWSRFKQEMNQVEAGIKAHNKLTGQKLTPNDFLGSMRTMNAPFADTIQKYRILLGENPSSPEAKQRLDELLAAERFHQSLASKQVDYYKEKIGGTQSPQELQNLVSVITQSSDWNQIQNFADTQLQSSGDKWRALLSKATPGGRMFLEMRVGPESNIMYDVRGKKISR